MNNWTKPDIEYICTNYGHIPTPEIALELDRSENSIRLKANRMNLIMENRGKFRRRGSDKFWTPEEDEYLRNKYPLNSTRDIAKYLGKSQQAIYIHAMKRKIPKLLAHWPTKPDADKTYLVNSLSFVLMNSATAYSLGFLVADGNVGPGRIDFSNNNFDILLKIRETLSSTHRIYENINRVGHPAFRLTIVDRDLCNSVLALGITPNKSLTAEMPRVPDELFPHFLRGYFDGDGSSRYGKRTGLVVKFTSGSKLLLEGIKQHIIDCLGIYGSAIVCDKGKANAWRLYYCGKKALALGNAMYSEAEELYIPEKRANFSAYTNHLKEA
jgi:hypothetical protein